MNKKQRCMRNICTFRNMCTGNLRLHLQRDESIMLPSGNPTHGEELTVATKELMSLDERFDAAVTIIQKLPKEGPVSTSNEQKLEFYSLFKQATVGDVNTDRPGIFSIVERRKWDAWKAVEGVSKEEAKQRYIKVLLKMFDQIAEELDMDVWLNQECDPIIKTNLALLGKS
ncbi:acyl CoA binding protein [Ancylostoma ceylanicum]|uniref:Acyl CoA binding protein n=3 Tax=Ancylostoma TaxID=29169 RepID=A0A0D6M8N5_9BILA|nr:acyl CoA binding protein [Ancylostoma ceylanicum]